jgi:cytochrome oxidase Cu insertion factor (SCO1/SenC/PrrC family)
MLRFIRGVLALALVCSLPALANAQKAPQVGQAAPDFTFTDANGKTVSLAEYKGKKNVLVVVNRGWIGYW